MTKQCEEYVVTHDLGNPIVHFMYNLPSVQLPEISGHVPNREDTSQELLGMHAVGQSGSMNTTENTKGLPI